MKKLLLASIAALIITTPALAQRASPLMHNGSLMEVVSVAPQTIEIRYVEPRPSLWAAGVQPGTVLVRGRWVGDTLYGTARIFRSQCGSASYQVQGSGNSDGLLTLRGPAPIVDEMTCTITGYSRDSNNAVLTFFPAPVVAAGQ